jgi:hypothetical protein
VPYDQSDPRAQLSTAVVERRQTGGCFAPQYFEFDALPPDEVAEGGTRSWYVRSQNCCVVFSRAIAGDRLTRNGHPDEYMVLLPDEMSAAVVAAGGDRVAVSGGAVVVVPPGDSEITMGADGIVVRLFSTVAADLVERCRNADVYATRDPNVAPMRPWPEPTGGYRVRVYPLSSIEQDAKRFGRILRCSTIMVNYFYPDDTPRDPASLSPHHHDDFEQISLQLDGDYVHHIRTPWTVNMADWRDDDHRFCASPAVTVIPPPTVHTSQSLNAMRHQLIDVFCPPRIDFSERPGWVVNADEYPMPEGVTRD